MTDAAARSEDRIRGTAPYRTEMAGTLERGDLTLAQMEALRDRIGAGQGRLEALGVELVHGGPDASRRRVVDGLAIDLAAADRALRQEYGADL